MSKIEKKSTIISRCSLHTLTGRRSGRVPLPRQIWLREGSTHDLTAFKNQLIKIENTTLFADKAYCDKNLKLLLGEQNTRLCAEQKQTAGAITRR